MNVEWSISPFSTVVLTALTVGFGVYFTTRRKQEESALPKSEKPQLKPEKWALVGRVEKLIIYPIKSCQGVVVDKAEVTTLGLKFPNHNLRDRDFMVVDKKGKSITMMQIPKIALITMNVCGKDTLRLSAPGMDDIDFTYPDPDNNKDEQFCRVKHDKNVKALDCGDEIAEWLQLYLEKESLRLYYHHINKTQRTFEPYMFQCPQFELSDMGAFHNETSYLMVAQESIDELNERIDKKSSWKNWRPTILIDKISEPFAEVNWSFVRIGNQNGILKSAVPCYRCPITTIDNDTGIFPKDGEPLKTLREMNKADQFADKQLAELLKNKGIMGLRLGLYLPAGEGAILNVGDPVYAALL